jgi:argininosuccinate lyase
MLQRDIARLQNLWPQVNQSPLGAAALAGTTFPIDRNYLAELLQFDGIYQNSLDAVSNRDYVIEFLNANALIMMHLSRFCEELILWSSQEFNFIQFSDAFTTGSSIMPQKKNPDIAELARGKTGRVYGSLFNLFTIMKGLPLAYNKDLQEDKEPFFDSIKTVNSTLAIFNSMLKTITINENKMRTAVAEGFLNATDLADYLVNKNLSFREAHHVAGQLVALCIKENCQLENLSLAKMQSFSNLITDDVYQFIDLKACVDKRNSDGGTGKLSIQKQLQQAENILSNNVNWLEQKQKLLIKAKELLTPFS